MSKLAVDVSVTLANNGKPPQIDPMTGACTMIYAPVCLINDTSGYVFTNNCTAYSDEYTVPERDIVIGHHWLLNAVRDGSERPLWSSRRLENKCREWHAIARRTMCTMQYDP